MKYIKGFLYNIRDVFEKNCKHSFDILSEIILSVSVISELIPTNTPRIKNNSWITKAQTVVHIRASLRIILETPNRYFLESTSQYSFEQA